MWLLILLASTSALEHLWLHLGLFDWCLEGCVFVSCKSSCTRLGHREGWLGRLLLLFSMLACTQRTSPRSMWLLTFLLFDPPSGVLVPFVLRGCTSLCSHPCSSSCCHHFHPVVSSRSDATPVLGRLLVLAWFCSPLALWWGFCTACLCCAARHPRADSGPWVPVPLAGDLLVCCDLRDRPGELPAMVWISLSCTCSGLLVLCLHLTLFQGSSAFSLSVLLFLFIPPQVLASLCSSVIWRCSMRSHHQLIIGVGSQLCSTTSPMPFGLRIICMLCHLPP